MQLLKRNRQTIYYQNYSSMTPIKVTGTNIETGEYTKAYGALQTVKAYVKAAIGATTSEPFGDYTDKDRVIYLADTDMTEQTILWVGIDPAVDKQGAPTVPHNYIVTGISRGLNHCRISIRKVDVDG